MDYQKEYTKERIVLPLSFESTESVTLINQDDKKYEGETLMRSISTPRASSGRVAGFSTTSWIITCDTTSFKTLDELMSKHKIRLTTWKEHNQLKQQTNDK